MKTLLKMSIVLTMIVALIGCVTMQFAPTDNPVCERPEFANSWICAQLKSLGFANAEDAEAVLLDANDISLILEVYTEDQLTAKLVQFEEYLKISDISYTMFFDLVAEDTKKAKRVAAILMRRFKPLKSVEIIKPSDRQLLHMLIDDLHDTV